MLLDFENKKPMEIEAILGNTLAIAKKNNIEAPLLQTLYSQLKTVEKKRPTR